jgi:hypothetical protein
VSSAPDNAARIRNRVEDRAAPLIYDIAIDDLNACGQIFQLRPVLPRDGVC